MLRSLITYKTRATPPFLLIRFILGYVFFVAGAQKFLFYESRGPGRFLEMGFAYPEFTAWFVGFFEIACALLLILGLLTRLASIPLAIIMVVAIITTKLPLLADDIWVFAHALRLDLSMLLLSVYCLFIGADRFSLDHRWFRDRS